MNENENQVDDLKNKIEVREALAFAHYVLNNRVQFLHEEFQPAAHTISTLKQICEHLQKEIEELSPKEETKKDE